MTHGNAGHWQRWKTTMTWDALFGYLAPHLLEFQADAAAKAKISEAAATQARTSGTQPTLDDYIFQTLKIQFMALGLTKVDDLPTTDGKRGLFWSLTPAGKEKLLLVRTVRAAIPPTVTDATKAVGAPANPALNLHGANAPAG